MQYLTDINMYQSGRASAVTLGKFDGLHLGHQKLIGKVCAHASEDVGSVVCAFSMGQKFLLSERERRSRLESCVDCLLVLPFTETLRKMEAEEFLRLILVQKLRTAYLAVGTDFRFGYQKKGDVEMLSRYASVYGYCLDIVEKEFSGGQAVSSTRIREMLSEGRIKEANILLGVPYRITGRVEHGRKLGRTLGFPTMNVAPEKEKFLPRFGVYACNIFVDGNWFHGIGNVGIKPTVESKPRPLVEVYAFGYAGDAYGKEVTVEFCAFERPEKKFSEIGDLKAQVEADIVFGQEYFALDPV